MDVVYPLAFIAGAIVSLVVSLVTNLAAPDAPKAFRGILIVIVAILVFAASVDWHALGVVPLRIAVMDSIFIFAAAALGAVLGTIPLRLRRRR